MPLNTPDGPLNYALDRWLKRDLSLPLRKTLRSAMEQAIRTATPEARSNLVAIIAPNYMGDVLARRDLQQANLFLKSQAPALEAFIPFETALWQMQLSTLEGRGDLAGQALSKAATLNPAYTNSPEYARNRELIFKLNSTTITPISMDVTPQSVLDTVDGFARNGETNALCTFIKDVLRARNYNAIASESDTALFLGAKPYYRRSLAKYAPAYEAWLNQDIETLAKQPTRQADADRLSLIARFTPAGKPGTLPPAIPLPTAPVQNAFTPLLDMAPGAPEVCENHLRFTVYIESVPTPTASLSVTEGQTWLANSRMLARLQSGRVLWSWAAPLQQLTDSGASRQPLRTLGKTQPAVAGSTVAISALAQDAALLVVGLDRNTGAYLWSWQADNSPVVSDPVAWGTNRFAVIQQTGQSAIATLVILDAGTGKELSSVPLCASQTAGGKAIKAGSVTFNQDASWKLPAPSIEGDFAYVLPSLGLVGAINLADESMVWMRNYTRFADPDLIGLRQHPRPIPGRSSVLFAPWDSNSLLLTEKTTGKLLATRTDLPWCDAAPCGPDHALILTRTTAHVVSLADLKDVKMFPARNLRLTQVVREGCLVATADASILLIRPDGTTKTFAPPSNDREVLGCDPEGNWYSAGGPGLQWFGINKGSIGAAPPLRHPQFNLPSTCTLNNGVLLYTKGPRPLVQAGQVVTAALPLGVPRWELPTPGNARGVQAFNNRLVLAHSGRLWIHDASTSELIETYPAGRATTPNILAVFPDPGGPGFAVGRDDNPDLALWALDANGRPTGQPVARMDKNLASMQFEEFYIISGPSHISALTICEPWANRSAIWTAPRKPEPAVLKPTTTPPAFYVWVSNDETQGAVITLVERFFLLDAAGFREDTTKFVPGKRSPYAEDGTWTSGALIEARRDTNWTEYLNPLTKNMFFTKSSNIKPSAAIGTQVYGLKIEPGSSTNQPTGAIQPVSISLAGDKASTVGAPLPAWVNDLPLSANWQASAFASREGPVLILAPPSLNIQMDYVFRNVLAVNANSTKNFIPPPRNDSVAIVWTAGNTQKTCRIPNVPLNATIWSTAQGLVNLGGTWMSASQWESALRIRNSVHACPTNSETVSVDGFLEDWNTNEFFSIPNGSMAMHVNAENELAIAVRITNPDLAARIGVTGLDERFEISILEDNTIFFGESPATRPQHPLAQGRTSEHNFSIFSGKGYRFNFAWTVHPTGKYCQIEATAAGVPLSRIQPNSKTLGVRLLWYPSPFDPPVNLAGEVPFGPLSYVMSSF